MLGTYNPWLVALSVAIAIYTSWVGLSLSGPAWDRQDASQRQHWLFASSLTLGTGVWTMHFIGMLAFSLPIPFSYDIPITIASLLVAIVSSASALILARRGPQKRWLLAGGVCMGLGISAMHYLGMLGINITPAIRFDHGTLLLSVAIAIIDSLLALTAVASGYAVATAGRQRRLLAATLLGCAISGMHYIGMRSAHFAVDSVCSTSPLSFDNITLGATVGAFAVLVLGAVLVMATLQNGRHSSRFALMLLTSASIAPMLLLTLLYVFNDYQDDTARAMRETIEQARSVARTVDAEMAGVEAGLQALATSPSLQSGDYPAVYRQAVQVLESLGATNVYLVAADGSHIFNTLRPYGDPLPAIYSAEGMERIFKRRQPMISDLVHGVVQRSPVVTVVVPVRRGAEVAYALGATIDPGRLSRLLARQPLHPQAVAAILDRNGVFISRNIELDRWLGKPATPELVSAIRQSNEGTVNTHTVEGTVVVGGFSRMSMGGWSVAIGIPKRALTSELWASLGMMAVYAIIFLGISLYMAWMVSGRIMTSIHALVRPALALGRQQTVNVPPLYLKELDKIGSALEEAATVLARTRHDAHHDPLTGLPNRILMTQVLHQQLSLHERTGDQLALLYMDLDGFKAVNDTYGHGMGDDLLRMVGDRINFCLRKADMAARLGGDEFAALLVNVDHDGATFVAGKLIESLSLPYAIDGQQLSISISIGIALAPTGLICSVEELLGKADEAMYRAKAAGKRQYAVAA
jgi:diguanylate cyclase (GGDEF)-like protein